MPVVETDQNTHLPLQEYSGEEQAAPCRGTGGVAQGRGRGTGHGRGGNAAGTSCTLAPAMGTADENSLLGSVQPTTPAMMTADNTSLPGSDEPTTLRSGGGRRQLAGEGPKEGTPPPRSRKPPPTPIHPVQALPGFERAHHADST